MYQERNRISLSINCQGLRTWCSTHAFCWEWSWELWSASWSVAGSWASSLVGVWLSSTSSSSSPVCSLKNFSLPAYGRTSKAQRPWLSPSGPARPDAPRMSQAAKIFEASNAPGISRNESDHSIRRLVSPPQTHTVAVCTASVLCCFHTNQTCCSVILLRRWRRFMKILICSDCVLQPHLYTEVHYFTCWTFTSTFEQCSKPLLVDDYTHHKGTILSNTYIYSIGDDQDPFSRKSY